MPRVVFCFAILTSLLSLKCTAQLGLRKTTIQLPDKSQIKILPQNFYNQHKGYLCKKEDLVQKATGLNLFFRLGSKSYVDYLENKPNAMKPY